MNKLIRKFLVSLIVVSCLSATAYAQKSKDNHLLLKAETGTVEMDLVIKNNFIKAKFSSAEKRFMQGNVKASYDDFLGIVNKTSHDDYVFLAYAMKMAEYGFFDLSDDMLKKLDDELYTKNYVDDIKRFYYPSALVNNKDILYLADAYASIVYNNLAIETTSELLNSKKISDSDYKNYLIALGFYKSNNLQQSLKYINNAIYTNDFNVNYKILKAKILADSNKSAQALKVLKEIKKEEFLTVDFQDKIKSAEEYVMYKIANEEPLKDYHLSYYYHLQDKSPLAIKVLQAAILQSKSHSSKIFGLLGKIYYEIDEPLKAQEFAQRAYKDDNKNYHAVITLADLYYDERKYEEALKFYKVAKRLTKDSYPKIGIANTYYALEDEKKSKKLYSKMIKKDSNDIELLVSALKYFPQKVDDYLPTIASLDLMNNDVWLALAGRSINEGNYVLAEKFLNNSFYIDENNFKYYYYLSLVLKLKGELEKSKQALIKCSVLNSDYAASINLGYGSNEK